MKLALSVALLGATAAQAAILVNDDFNSGTAHAYASVGSTIGEPVFEVADQKLAVTSAQAFARPLSSSVTLAGLSVGERLELSFGLGITSLNGATGSYNFNYGFATSATGGNPTTEDCVAYAYLAPMVTTASSSFAYRVDSLNLGNTGTKMGSPFGVTLNAATTYNVLFSITKVGAGSYEFLTSLDGSTLSQQTFGSPTFPASMESATISAIVFRNGNGVFAGTPNFTLDNVVAQTVAIPEPATGLLLAVTGLLLMRRR